jgi:hypothetical protein
MAFPINEHTGDALTDDDVTAAHYDKVGVWLRSACLKIGALGSLPRGRLLASVSHTQGVLPMSTP